MDKIKTPEANIVFDLESPNRDMFTRFDEAPTLAIVAVHPMHSKTVKDAREKVLRALYVLMESPTEELVVMEQDVIEMESGSNLVLTAASLIMSFQYAEGESKLVHLELDNSNKATIH